MSPTYVEFIRAGEILIAPSLEYKDHYVLKCSECDEYYGLVEDFWSHCLPHYGLESKMEESQPIETLEEVLRGEKEPQAIENYSYSIAAGYEEEKDPVDYGNEEDIVDPLNSLKYEAVTENVIVKEEVQFLDEPNVNCDGTPPHQTEHDHESIESDNEPTEDGQDTKTHLYIHNFLKSKKSVTALISAYKNMPHMWDYNYPHKLRWVEERKKSLQKIAAEMENVINLQMTCEQIAAIIFHLRMKYRERLKFIRESKEEPATSQKSRNTLPAWIFQSLEFLKPFIENNFIALQDSREQTLVPEQIIQMLGIYERCPYLWNTNLMEFYCNNKRNEGIEQMIRLIGDEMCIDVEKNALINYLRQLHLDFSREKRRKLGFSKLKARLGYFAHMMFLDEHVGPFECTVCKRKIRSPAYLKEHLTQHDGTIRLHCPSCNHEFRSVEAYVSHVRRHMGDLGHECKECGKQFLKPASLRIHMRSHTGDRPYFCEICGTSYRQQQELLEHRRKHEKKFIHYCPICSKGFYTKTKMKAHIPIHHDARNFVCGTCGKAFKAKKTLKNHEFTHEEGRNHECDVCGKLFKNKINLGHHKRTHVYKLDDLNTSNF